MALKKLSLDIYEKYRNTIDRYMELVPCEQREKVDTATIHVMYAIEDINYQIEKFANNASDISIFYQTMLKTDFLIGAIEALYEIFFNFNKSKRKKIWGNKYNIIRQFRLYRSLTLAHPLSTTYYDDLGYGDENKKWCEDVRSKNAFYNLFDKQFQNADYIILVKVEGKEGNERISVSLERDILAVDLIALQQLKAFTRKIEQKLINKKEELKKTPISIDPTLRIKDYIYTLLEEVKKRYPSTIENIVYANDTEVQHHILLEALERLEYSFKDAEREKKYNVYKEEIQQAVYSYAESVQDMTLEDDKSDERLQQLLHPDSSILSDKSKEEQAHYKYGKIVMYLSDSDERSVENAKWKLEQLSYDGCRSMGVCTNAEWGVIQLLIVQKDFLPYFSIDFDATDKELYFQFCTALYYANKSTN